MTGVLQFTLGLEVQGFLNALGLSSGKVLSLAGAAEGLEKVIQGTWRAVAEGSALAALSRRTGEGVGSLYQLQKGFQAAGLSAEEVPMVLFQMQKSLGGVNEMGERTDDVFRKLGLSVGGLKGQNATQQVAAIAGALSRLDASSASKASSMIFGRAGAGAGAGAMMQVARSSEQFSAGMKNAASQGAVFERMAGVFEKLRMTMGFVKDKVMGIWSGVAEGLGPALQGVLDMLNSIDVVKVGQDIGMAVTAGLQAFREGRLAELLADSCRVGFETILDFAPAIFEKVGFLLLKALETPIFWLQAAFARAGEVLSEKIATLLKHVPGADKFVNTDYKAQSFDALLDEAKKGGKLFGVPGAGEFSAEDVNKDANERLSKATAAFKERWKGFWGEIQDFASRAPRVQGMTGSGAGKSNFDMNIVPLHRLEGNVFEKMGFVMGAGNGLGAAEKTAANTEIMVALMRQQLAKDNGGGTAVNADM